MLRPQVRQRRLRAGARPGARDASDYRRVPRASRTQARGQGRLTSASASRPTSRCAASRRRPGSGRSGEGWGAGLWESANVRVHLTGKVVVTTGSQPHGQGHETTMAQVVGRRARRPARRRDGRALATRSARRSATAPTAAAAPRSAGWRSTRALAADQGEGQAHRRPHARGRRRGHRLRGRHRLRQGLARPRQDDPGDRRRGRRRLRPAAGEEPFLDDTAYYDPPNCTFPFGTHVGVVEVDRRDRRGRAAAATSRSTTSGT